MSDLRDLRDEQHVVVNESAVYFRGHIMDVVEDEVTLVSTGARMKREYIVHDDAVGIVAVRDGEEGLEVLLIRQYRHPLRSLMWEIPAGLLDLEGEDPREAAVRELAEETDMAADSFDFLANFYTSPGCSTELLTVFLARGLHEIETSFTREDEEAEIEIRWFPFSRVLDAIRAGDLASPTLVVGVLAAAARLGVN